jgi:hypothetical protein
MLVPTTATTNEKNKKMAIDKFITCVFLQEWIPKVWKVEKGRDRKSTNLAMDKYKGSNGFYKRGAYRGNINNKNSLQGNIAELGNNVYQYGIRDQGDSSTRTTEAIPDHVGREYSKEMRFILVKNQKENELKENAG